MKQGVHLEVNGETRDFADGIEQPSVLALIASLGLDAELVVAEVNGEIVKRSAFADTLLADNDKVELVRFVGGG